MAKIYLRENRLDDAVAHLEKAVVLDPKDNSAYSHLIVAYRRQGKSAEANQTLEALKRLNAEERTAHYSIRIVKNGTPQY